MEEDRAKFEAYVSRQMRNAMFVTGSKQAHQECCFHNNGTNTLDAHKQAQRSHPLNPQRSLLLHRCATVTLLLLTFATSRSFLPSSIHTTCAILYSTNNNHDVSAQLSPRCCRSAWPGAGTRRQCVSRENNSRPSLHHHNHWQTCHDHYSVKSRNVYCHCGAYSGTDIQSRYSSRRLYHHSRYTHCTHVQRASA